MLALQLQSNNVEFQMDKLVAVDTIIYELSLGDKEGNGKGRAVCTTICEEFATTCKVSRD